MNRELNAFWVEWKDEGDTQSLWYFRSSTAGDYENMIECTWNIPDLPESPKNGNSSETVKQIATATTVENAMPAHLQTNWDELRASSPLKQRRSSVDKQFDWSEHFDEASGAYWYYNNRTGESTWDQPREWIVYAERET